MCRWTWLTLIDCNDTSIFMQLIVTAVGRIQSQCLYFQLDRFILCKIHYSMWTLWCLENGKFNELIIVPSSKKTKLNSQIIVNYAQIKDCLVHCEHWEHGIAVATEVRSNSIKTKNLISDFSSYLRARTKAHNLRQLLFWCWKKNLKLRF